MSLRVDDLERLAERAGNESAADILAIFASSINDWPFNPLTVDEYIRSVEETVNGPATKDNLECYLAKYKPGKDAWKAESIAGLLEIYQHADVNASLKAVLSTVEAIINKDGSSTA